MVWLEPVEELWVSVASAVELACFPLPLLSSLSVLVENALHKETVPVIYLCVLEFFLLSWQKVWREEGLLYLANHLPPISGLYPNQATWMLPCRCSSARSGFPGCGLWHLRTPVPEASKTLPPPRAIYKWIDISPSSLTLLAHLS